MPLNIKSLLYGDKKGLLVLLALLVGILFFPMGKSAMTQEEKRISQALSKVEGAGCVQVAIYYSGETGAFGGERECIGAVAVCEGAGDMGVRINVARALETLLGLDARDVIVLKMKEGK